jgi:hypothetical protein
MAFKMKGHSLPGIKQRSSCGCPPGCGCGSPAKQNQPTETLEEEMKRLGIDGDKLTEEDKDGTWADEAAGDKAINDAAGMHGTGKGRRLFELSKKELQNLGFGPDKIKEIMADGTKNPMSQEEVLEEAKPQNKTRK